MILNCRSDLLILVIRLVLGMIRKYFLLCGGFFFAISQMVYFEVLFNCDDVSISLDCLGGAGAL